MHRILLLLILAASSLVVFAQSESGNGTVHISIQTEANAALENATVELVRSTDSVLVRSAIADKSGQALFEKLPAGSYRARASLIGFATDYTAPFSITAAQTEVTVPALTLTQANATQLSGVTVTAR